MRSGWDFGLAVGISARTIPAFCGNRVIYELRSKPFYVLVQSIAKFNN